MLASQQLRALHAENQSLRGEVNQWRQRAGVPGVAEPRRGEAFVTVLTGAELELDPMDACEDEECDEFSGGMPYSCAPPMHQRSLSRPDSHSPFGYGVSPPSSSSSSASSFPSPYSTPYSTSPSSATFGLPTYAKYDMAAPHGEPRIACPTPANPFEAQHFMLKAEDEWTMYASPPTHFQDQASW